MILATTRRPRLKVAVVTAASESVKLRVRPETRSREIRGAVRSAPSSFVIVAVAVGVATDALDGDNSASVNDSSASALASPITVTVIDFERSPGANESVPVAARKSAGAFAVPFCVA